MYVCVRMCMCVLYCMCTRTQTLYTYSQHACICLQYVTYRKMSKVCQSCMSTCVMKSKMARIRPNLLNVAVSICIHKLCMHIQKTTPNKSDLIFVLTFYSFLFAFTVYIYNAHKHILRVSNEEIIYFCLFLTAILKHWSSLKDS